MNRPTPAAGREPPSARLLHLLAKHPSVLVVAHDHPDPDAISAGWAVATLVREKLGLPVRLVARGPVMRAENRRLLSLLKPPLEMMDTLPAREGSAVVLVDCSPAATSHVLGASALAPVAVIDHHKSASPLADVPFQDLRTRYAATATIATEYLREQELLPGAPLATALLYAIQSDAMGWMVLSRADQRAITWLTDHADLNKLASIRYAPLKPAYYADLLLALESTVLFGDAALCFLPRVSGVEMVAEIADLLVRRENVHRVACVAVVDGSAYVSVRASQRGGDAADLAHRLLDGLGQGGGHRYRAGGKFPAAGSVEGDGAGLAPAGSPTTAADIASEPSSRLDETLQAEVRRRWLEICGRREDQAEALVARREIIDNL